MEKKDLVKLSLDCLISRALFTATELEIASHLRERSLSLEALAMLTDTEQSALKRLMRLLIANNIFHLNSDGNYENNDLSKMLLEDHPESIKMLVLHEDETRWNSYGNLTYSIKTGKPSFDHLYGEDYFSYLKKQPILSQRFDKAMTQISAQEEKEIAAIYPFQNAQRVMDIGGGKGGLIANILAKYDHVFGVLFDLPQVIENNSFPLLKQFESRYSTVMGSFFDTSLSLDADIIILKRILHDWDDAKSIEILSNISNAMSKNSKILIVDAILGLGKDNDIMLLEIDLLLLSVFGGKERSLKEFQQLFIAAGLEISQIYPTNSMVSIIELQKK